METDADLTIAPATACVMCGGNFFERGDAVQHLADHHAVTEGLERAAGLVLSQVQRRRPVAEIIKILRTHSESSDEGERIDPKSNKAKARLETSLFFASDSGAPSSRFRSCFFENTDFGILTSTYTEFDAGHENGLLFGIWRPLEAKEADASE